jgi:hypothetical protein
VTTVARTSTQSASSNWEPCAFQTQIDQVRDRHEDLVRRVGVASREEVEQYVSAVGALLEHLSGLHFDDVLVQLLAEGRS